MDPSPDLTIVLLGNSGVGKSVSGNTILWETVFESKRSSTPVTRQISERTRHVFGKKISVVDTPGIFGSEDTIRSWCRVNLDPSMHCLYLVVVKVDTFTIEQGNAVEAALRVTRDLNVSPYLLFTRGDDLGDMTLENFINEDPDSPLRAVADRFEGRLHVFNNKNGGQDQVRELLEKSGHLRDVRRQPPAHPLPQRRIVLLGLPGVGKSSSGNIILGSERFGSACSFNSVSTDSESESATVEGRQVTVVDTPGLSGRNLTPKKMFEEIMGSVIHAAPGPHVFVIVVRISRITVLEPKLFDLVSKLFGKDALKFVMVLFTYGDELRGQDISALIRDNNDVNTLVSRCNDRYCVFDNTKRQNRRQVLALLNVIDRVFTANQENHYTSKKFKDAISWKVHCSIKWEETGDWFKQMLCCFDSREENS